MSILNQRSLKNAIEFGGVGLHTGKRVNLKLLPASPNTGIQFKRVDLKNNNLVWSLEGPNQEVLVGNFIKTEFLNVKLIKLLPKQKTHVPPLVIKNP